MLPSEAKFCPEADAGEHSFRHPLTQQVAYHGQIAGRRESTHTAIATALEDLRSERLGECASLIAHHWEAAGKGRIAHAWRRRAALRVSKIQVKRGSRRG